MHVKMRAVAVFQMRGLVEHFLTSFEYLHTRYPS